MFPRAPEEAFAGEEEDEGLEDETESGNLASTKSLKESQAIVLLPSKLRTSSLGHIHSLVELVGAESACVEQNKIKKGLLEFL